MMKRWLLIFALLLCSAPVWASISNISHLTTPCAVSTASTGASCSLSTTTTLGNDVIVGLSWRTDSSALIKVVGSSTSAIFAVYAQSAAGYQCNATTGTCSAVLVCRDCPVLTSVTPTFSSATKYVLTESEWSGVTWIGITGVATGSSAAPSLSMTTGDSNDYIVSVVADAGSATPTAGTGTLVGANNTGSSGVAGAMVYNTAASPGSVTTSVSITSAAWSVIGLELRTTAAKTYIWPDCDSTHPCLIYHKHTHGIDESANTLTTPYYLHVSPSLASNALELTITHPSGITVSSIADNNSGSWSSGVSVTDSTDTTMIDVRYICGAAAGTSAIAITMSGTFVGSTPFQVDYNEWSGIATSSCERNHNGLQSTAVGNLQPGASTTVAGDLGYAFTIDATGNQENSYASGWFPADDLSSMISDDNYDNVASSQQVVSGTSYNPTMYVNSVTNVNSDPRFFIIGEAFKASSGAGTQPPATQAWVTRSVMYRNANAVSTIQPQLFFPTNGNAFVLASSVFQNSNTITSGTGGSTISKVSDNLVDTFEANGVTDVTADPQQVYVCLGAGGGVRKDLVLTWPMNGTNNDPEEVYDIANAKQSTGTGCVGTISYHGVGAVASGTCSGSPLANQCANVVSNSSQFSTPYTFTPTLNGSSTSAIILTGAFTQGPPAAYCNSGGQTAPTCNNDMGAAAATTGAGIKGPSSATSLPACIFSSIWISGMGDASHFSNGDGYGWCYFKTKTSTSIDYWLANSAGSSGTGVTAINEAVVEILGVPAASTVSPPMWVISP